MQARLHSPTDVWSKLWCSFWHIINTLQQKKIFLVPCVLHGRSLQLGGCGVTPGGVEEGMDVVWGEGWMEL